MRKFISAAIAATVLATSFAVASPASAEAAAPSVRCMRLDNAITKVRRAGYPVGIRGGGLFGVVVKSAWVVVHQKTGYNGKVYLWAGRYC